MNRVILSGRLVSDPEIRATGSGVNVAKFSLAVNEYIKGEEKTSFFDCTAFGKTADFLRQYSQKGSRVLVDGSLRQEKWQDSEGNNRYKISIIVNRVELMGSTKQKEESENYNHEYEYGEDDSDDIPF
ncbi:MAG TPA: single-stranded DNA-binding protein [Spirochaetota bacterium]|nr:single-stranded DNA-binding protein [Spirochaetota bacterium]HOM38193.1 single-stranded DNA-binding protein [Spirochaetota bacterium]HPQ48589.1 single-stranded DNA-binding protein [Spirochaetota bacterium]